MKAENLKFRVGVEKSKTNAKVGGLKKVENELTQVKKSKEDIDKKLERERAKMDKIERENLRLTHEVSSLKSSSGGGQKGQKRCSNTSMEDYYNKKKIITSIGA